MTLLVLAASLYQLDAIRTAKRLGMRVITTDTLPSNPGHALADRAYSVDTTNVSGVIEIAKVERIDGVIAPCTDVAVYTAARVAEELGLPGVRSEAARIVTSKATFREFMAMQGMRVPRYQILDVRTDLPTGLFTNGQRCIIKPDKASGSKGIFILGSDAELSERLPQSLAHSPNGKLVIEEFIDGHQGTVEGVLREGRAALKFILDRQTAPAPYVSTTGHQLPTVLHEGQQTMVVEAIETLWQKLGVTESVFDCDFVIQGDKVYLIEITPRLGGNSISQLLRWCAGVDLVEISVQAAVGAKMELPPQPQLKPSAVALLGVWTAGRLVYEEDAVRRCCAEPWVHRLTMDVQSGAEVQPFMNGRHRLGEAFVGAETRGQLTERVRCLEGMLGLSVMRP
jgi:biotin carboxylase